MPSPRDLARGRSPMLPLIVFTLREGWHVSRAANGRLTFDKAGLPPIFTGPVSADHRSGRIPPPTFSANSGGRHG
ncbi:type II toxin-antitoxin system HicA family toxin [Shinella sp.]|uniref:type II toxin-antitoxin system HicA family toxin n=1 Tax=Shinella sp. TaxID=1870904 RepID=UPI0025895FF7|nr:type II toxin-antitoxin system HicA family toxin [Shinella sp.]MCW5706907.1 type II toxin-antitoxin system HicA family toxin [Shinella sp.]